MLETPESPLVLTKLRAPRTRPGGVPRARLLERLASETGADLGLVCAPAGYGKTTLLAEWARRLNEQGWAVAWVGLDGGDDDPAHFGAYLVAAFSQALGATPELAASARLLRSSPGHDLRGVVPAVINAAEASGRECALILDDYHLIRSPAVHSAVAYLLERRPENLRVYLGSRSDPPLPLARLRARGRLLELRAADLRFSATETAWYLNEVMGLGLLPETVAALEERTEGWAAGLQLAALALASRADKEGYLASFSGSHRYLVEYLLDEVLDRQPAEVRAFLLHTALLERLCAPLCAAVLAAAGEDGSQAEERLGQVERLNLFLVALDDEGRWYRYHHLFRDFLQARLERQGPPRAAELRRAAAEWLADNRLLREAGQQALEQARQNEDWEFGAGFVERHGFKLIIHSEMALLAEWCAALPEQVFAGHPLLCILQCWPWVFRFQSNYRERIEARLRLVEQATAAMGASQAARDLNEHAAVVRTFLAMAPDPDADARGQLEQARKALRAFPPGDGGQFSPLLTLGYCHMALGELEAAEAALEQAREIALRGNLYAGIVEATFHLARLAHARGNLRHAEALCRQGQADLAGQPVAAAGVLEIALGSALLEQDRLEAAERALTGGLEQMGWNAIPYYQFTACTALFRLREIQGRTAEALAALDRLEAAWPDAAFCARALREAHLAAQAGGGAKPAEGEACAAPPGMGPFGAADAYALTFLARQRARLAGGAAGAVLACLEPALARAEAAGLTARLIELRVLEALAARALGDERRALAALEQALEAGRPGGFVRSFDRGPALEALLERSARSGARSEDAARVLAAVRRSRAADGPGVLLAYGERLSERELEVLRLMAAGASNQDIAERLVITVGTVKSHVNHILSKLEARSRGEAVAKARGLGLPEI